MPGADLGDLVAEPGSLEVAGVGVDDRVGEEVAPGELDALVALAHPGVHVGVDLGVAALAHLLDRPRHVRRRQVVEEHAVGDLAGQREHLRVEGADDDLGLPLAEAHAEPEALHLVEVAREVDLLAGEALAQQRRRTRGSGRAGGRRRARRATGR